MHNTIFYVLQMILRDSKWVLVKHAVASMKESMVLSQIVRIVLNALTQV